jgi:hypothetical protein
LNDLFVSIEPEKQPLTAKFFTEQKYFEQTRHETPFMPENVG